MNWYVAKIVFRIVSGNGNHHAQFDEQLRLISADDEQQAFEKASRIGLNNQDSFLNNQSEQVKWQFIDVAEINQLNDLSNGTELYYQIHEAPDADLYIAWAHHKSALLGIKN
jgi:SLT domain-containing protein